MIMKETKNPRNHSIHLPQSFLFVSAGKTDAIAVVGDAGRKANDKESRQVTGCNTRGKQALSITGRNTTGKQTLNMGETQQVHKLSSLPADARSYTTALSTDNLRNVRCYASFSRLLQKEDNLRWVFIPSFLFPLPSRCLFQQNSRVQAWSCFIFFLFVLRISQQITLFIPAPYIRKLSSRNLRRLAVPSSAKILRIQSIARCAWKNVAWEWWRHQGETDFCLPSSGLRDRLKEKGRSHWKKGKGKVKKGAVIIALSVPLQFPVHLTLLIWSEGRSVFLFVCRKSKTHWK